MRAFPKKSFMLCVATCIALACALPVAAFADDNALGKNVEEGTAEQTQPSSRGIDAAEGGVSVFTTAPQREGEAAAAAPSTFAPFRSTASSAWRRLAGATAADTMQVIVQNGWNASRSVVVATDESYKDALSASPLAGYLKAPILLTSQNALRAQTVREIVRLGAKTAYIVGGAAAVDPVVEDQLRAAGCTKVERIWGKTADDTAAAIADHLRGVCSTTAIVATDGSFQDALSIAAYSYKTISPIYLTANEGTSLGELTQHSIGQGKYNRAIVVGGKLAVKEAVENQLKSLGPSEVLRIKDATAEGTSKAIANWCVSQGMSVANASVATSLDYRDALVGGAFCGKNNSVLLLIKETGRGSAVSFLNGIRPKITMGYLFGGRYAISKMSELLVTTGALPSAYDNVAGHDSTGLSKLGIDVSQWQGWINWPKVKAAGIDFAIVRVAHGAGEGSVVDTYYRRNVREAKAAGIELGVYIYSDATTVEDARNEANHVISLLSSAGVSAADLPLGVYYDLEDPKLQKVSNRGLLLDMTKAFTARMKAGGYNNLGVYSNLYWWTTFLPSDEYNQWNRWVAQYNNKCHYTGAYKMWQFRSTGRVDGVDGNVDMNIGYW